MTDKNLTDAEIKKALECCSINSSCTDCPLAKTKSNCGDYFLDLINRQEEEKQNLEIELQAMRNAANGFKAEVEELKCKNSNLTSDLTSLQNNLTSAKAEVERLITLNSKLEGENYSLRVKANHYNFLYDNFVNTPTNRIKAEAYKEFWEKLWKLDPEIMSKVVSFDLDELNDLKNELVGDGNA